MRWLCAFFLCAAGTAAGFTVSLRLTRREKTLKDILLGFESLRNSIVYLAMPLGQALKLCSEPLCLLSFPPADSESLFSLLHGCGLTRAEAAEIRRYLQAMMSMNMQQREMVCCGAIEMFTRIHSQAQAQKTRDGKLSLCLGLMAGTAAGILIL